LEEATSLSEQHFPSPDVTPLYGHKVYHTGNQGVVIPGFSVPNFIKTCKCTTGWQEPEIDHRNSLNVDKNLIHYHTRNAPDQQRG
jgi:hypothetical protein